MSTGYTKPKWHELQEDLEMIAEVPDRITEFKQVRLKEILIYIDRAEQDRLKLISHLLIHQPERTFEHWAKNARSVFTLNELKELKGFIINYLNNKTTHNPVFKDPPSQRFFEFLFYGFIKIDKTPKTAVQYVFRQFFDTGNSIDLIEMNYTISGTMLDFANYYNSYILGRVPKERLKEFEIIINNKDPQIKELYRIGNKDKRKEQFNSLLLEFERNKRQ